MSPARSSLARQVRDYYRKRFADGAPLETIRLELELAHPGAGDSRPEAVAFWSGLAQGQWDCGVLQNEVRKGLEERAQGLDDAELREQLERLREANPKPRSRMRRFMRPIFEPGDCLAVRLSDGRYGAALVLAADNRPGHGRCNLVGALRYRDEELPDRAVFERREWLCLTHHLYEGETVVRWSNASYYPETGNSLIRVGNVSLREDDPKDSNRWSGFNCELDIELQYEWDEGVR